MELPTASPILVLALSVMTGAALAAPTQGKSPEVKAYEEASEELGQLEEELGKRLEAWLSSDNPYLRQTALLRYRAQPLLLSRTALKPLLAVLDDQENRLTGDCVHLVHRDVSGTPVAEVEYERVAACRNNER